MATVVPEFRVVVVGGTEPTAMIELVQELSRTPGLAIVASCPSVEVGVLRGASAMPVVAVDGRTPLARDRVYLLPRDLHVSIDGGELVSGDRGSAPFDCVLRSAGTAFGAAATGIVLAGTGTDGPLGIKRLKEEGGLTIAQQVLGRESELPAAAIETGLVDLVLPLGKIAARVRALVEAPPPEEVESDALRDILTLVRVRSGHDFAAYKRATLYRRIARRMQVCECATVEGYHRYLREHAPELANLLRDFLISVTNFFRDEEAFGVLGSDILPRLFANKQPNEPLRVWVAGCATGEEAYSLGMLLLEHAATLRAPPPIQIFATDIDETALAQARLGCYSDAISTDVSPERRERFFTRENGQYRVTKELRELVLFSPHNVLRDPPFSRLDLITCRNLLIYLNREAQSRVLAMFHFGLRPDGALFLGSSESAETSPAFTPTDAKHRLFARRPQPSSLGDALPTPARWQPPVLPSPFAPRERASSLGELHHRVVEYYGPPSVLVDAELDVLHLSERAGKFFQLSGGEPTRQVLRLVHPALRLELRSAIYATRQAGSDRRIVRYDAAPDEPRTIELHVRAAELPELGHGTLLITFEEVPTEGSQVLIQGTSVEPIVRELEEDLHRTRDQLRTTIEQYETSLEELKASNEELQAINEELRSATEELETSKEELQSVNEELTTVNHELKFKVDEISHANSDLQNLMTSTEIGVMFLDRTLNIKRFTPRVADLFNIIQSDLGRPLAHLTHRLELDTLVETAQSVLQTLRTVEQKITTRDGRAFLVRWLPYRSIEDRINGVVITFIDISEIRDAVAARDLSEHELRRVEERLRVAVASAPLAVLSFDLANRLTWAFVLGEETGERLPNLSAADRERLTEGVRAAGVSRQGVRLELELAGRVFDFRIDPGTAGVTAVGFDITPSKQAERALVEADRRKDEFLATLAHELRNPLAPLKLAIDVARLVGSDPEKRAASLAVMQRQVGMLGELVDELLDLSRLTHDTVLLERAVVDLAEVIEHALEAVRPAATAARHGIDVKLPPQPRPVFGDLRRLVQVFTNLLLNAVAYTPHGGSIQVVVADEIDGHTSVRVSDSGIGIEADLLPHIFEVFVHSRDESGRARGGLGIGLNVVRRLVELHGGTVEAASAGPERGSTFTVRLPVYVS